MADIGVSPSQLETIVPGLQYGLQQMSSMITSRREVVVHAQPGTYEPATSRLVRIHVADGSSWWQMATTKLVFEIVNPIDEPLELLVPPLGAFRTIPPALARNCSGTDLSPTQGLLQRTMRYFHLKPLSHRRAPIPLLQGH